MKRELTPFERWIRNKLKKQKNIEDQKIIDDMLAELKVNHDIEREKKIKKMQTDMEELKKNQMLELDFRKYRMK